jgi:long-chain acyl-CoA synthetase
MICVPRLLTRFYDSIQAKLNALTGVKKRIADWGVKTKIYNMETYGVPYHSIYDALLFGKIREVLGGRVRSIITGSAPISKDVMSFLKIAFCV